MRVCLRVVPVRQDIASAGGASVTAAESVNGSKISDGSGGSDTRGQPAVPRQPASSRIQYSTVPDAGDSGLIHGLWL